MPPTGRLRDDQIEDLAAWVDAGSPWPREQAPGQHDPGEAFDLESRRKEHWSWQPVRLVPAPAVVDRNWPRSTVDRFILAKLEEKGLTPAKAADRYTLLRRLSFDLTGLPPTAEEIARSLPTIRWGPLKLSWSASCHHHTSASGGLATGWICFATPNRTVVRETLTSRKLGATAIT